MKNSPTSPTDDEVMSVRKFALEIDEDYRKIYNNIGNPNYFLHRFIVLDKNRNMKVKKSAIAYYNTHTDKFDFVSDNSDKIDELLTENAETKDSDNSDNIKIFSDSSKIIIDLLQARIEEQSKELNMKNNQIEKLQTLLDQEQRLSIADKEKIKMLEESAQEQANQKKGFWNRLFGK